jgi:hypothetical protein
MWNSGFRLLAFVLLTTVWGRAQTTQGLITGRILDSTTGRPVSTALVSATNLDGTTTGVGHADSSGYFALPLLPPSVYRLRITADRYQAQELHKLVLAVSSRIEINFHMRPVTEVWEAGQYRSVFLPDRESLLTFFGPDVDASRSGSFEAVPHFASSVEPSVSDVIDPAVICNLPLAGRDIYAMLTLLPGVTTDAATGRGLGVAINGQRPTASNFLLDGVENNNSLVTGPLTSLAPEMVQEYRVSTSSWSAEYGRTAGFLANAVTRAGGEQWHGSGYANLKNDILDANTFQNNAHQFPRSPFKETEYGLQASGRLWKEVLFVSGGFDAYRSRSYQDPVKIKVPSPQVELSDGNPAKRLLMQFPTPTSDPGDGFATNLTVRPTVSLDRYLGLARADYVAGTRRVTFRVALNRFDWPDFIWYPFPDFRSSLTQPLSSLAIAYAEAIRPNLTHEFRAGWSRSTTRWDRPHPEIPTLRIQQTAIGPHDRPGDLSRPTLLPGSPLLYSLRDTSQNFEINDNWLWVRRNHILKAGGGVLLRNLNGLIATGQGGQVIFQTLFDFILNSPDQYWAAVARAKLPQYQQPAYDRSYRNNQYFLFIEDTWRIGSALVLNAGFRYENFAAPLNTGTNKDALVRLGNGADFPGRLANASLIFPTHGNQQLWVSDDRDFAPRFGFAWNGAGKLGVTVRGSYGIFFDRPFDNLWENMRNNSVVIQNFECQPPRGANICTRGPLGYLAPAASLPSGFQASGFPLDFPSLAMMDPGLRSGYTQSYFIGLRKRLFDSWDLELNTLGAMARRLVTTDVVNRPLSTLQGAYNIGLPEIAWRSNQGFSDYHALTAVARYRSQKGFLQAAYTWSHSIDNQSDPLAGDFFDLYFVNSTTRAQPKAVAAFSRQFDSRADRGNSDIDQRHNLILYSWWDVPAARGSGLVRALTRDWRAAQVAAFRSGFPYSVWGQTTGALINQRADLIQPRQALASPAVSTDGGVRLLNKAAFAEPPDGVLGDSGRNVFRGPGLWSVDLSISRSFGLRPLGESGRITLRADLFNALNHANLNNPDSQLSSPTFGQALYGRLGYDKGFPTLVPFVETARQVQLMVKVEF